MNSKAKVDQAQAAIDMSISTLGKDLMALVLQEIKAPPDDEDFEGDPRNEDGTLLIEHNDTPEDDTEELE